jgi:hypothetical protein
MLFGELPAAIDGCASGESAPLLLTPYWETSPLLGFTT